MKNTHSTFVKTFKEFVAALVLVAAANYNLAAQTPISPADEAIAAATAKIAAAPNDAKLYVERGTIYLKMRKLAEALADAEKAVALDPKNPHALNLRGNAKSVKKDFDGALSDYSRVIEMYPDKAFPAYFWRGEIYEIKDQWSKALADYSKALEIEPKFKPAARARERLENEIKAAGAAAAAPKSASAEGTVSEFFRLTMANFEYQKETKVLSEKYQALPSGLEHDQETIELGENIRLRILKSIEMLTDQLDKFPGTNYPPEVVKLRADLEKLLANNRIQAKRLAGQVIFDRNMKLIHESQAQEKVIEAQFDAAVAAGDVAKRDQARAKYIAQAQTTDKLTQRGANELGELLKTNDDVEVLRMHAVLVTTASQATIKVYSLDHKAAKKTK